MDFLKKHYEKVILSVVLLALAGASAFLVLKVNSVQQFLKENEDKIVNTKEKPLKPVNLSTNQGALQRLTQGSDLKLTGDHKIFNPVTWIRTPDGKLVPKAADSGPPFTVLSISPLNLVIVYEGTNGTGESLRYQFAITREADAKPANRRKLSSLLSATSPGNQNEVIILEEIRGPKEKPDAFVIRIREDKSQVVVQPDKPFIRGMAWKADLKASDGRVFKDKRRGDKIQYDGETYILFAIGPDSVTLAWRNSRKPLPYNAPQPQ